MGGIVYLSRNGVHKVEYPTLVADLLRLLPAEEAGGWSASTRTRSTARRR